MKKILKYEAGRRIIVLHLAFLLFIPWIMFLIYKMMCYNEKYDNVSHLNNEREICKCLK